MSAETIKSPGVVGSVLSRLAMHVTDARIQAGSRLAFGLASSLIFTPVAWAVWNLLDLKEIHILYMIPVIASAIRYGALSGLGASVTGSLASAFFFYPPIYSFAVVSQQQFAALAIFMLVAVITGHLSATASANAARLERSYRKLEQLYAFSRRLARAGGRDDISSAIQEHVSSIIGSPVIAVIPDDARAVPPAPSGGTTAPEEIAKRMLREAQRTGGGIERASFVIPESGRVWALRPILKGAETIGALAVELPDRAATRASMDQAEIDLLLDNAIELIDRLDLAAGVTEARIQRQGELLREAIIGSVSHGLRTPLAAITGSASIMSDVKAVKDDPRLHELTEIILQEANRLNSDIGNLLDAAALTTAGLEPKITLVEPSDLIGAALTERRDELATRKVAIDIPENVPYLLADTALARSALGLLIDNALRYSEAGSSIDVVVRAEGPNVLLSVLDEGVGVDPAELDRLLEKYYRGSGVRATTRGSGLGLWIASSFVGACGGEVRIARRDDVRGTVATVVLPAFDARLANESSDEHERPEVRLDH